jgi:hypothetical protein
MDSPNVCRPARCCECWPLLTFLVDTSQCPWPWFWRPQVLPDQIYDITQQCQWVQHKL